jgi:hypothetical protein
LNNQIERFFFHPPPQYAAAHQPRVDAESPNHVIVALAGAVAAVETGAEAIDVNPTRSAMPTQQVFDGRWVPPPATARRPFIDSSCSVRSGAAALMPAIGRTSLSSRVRGGARCSKVASTMPSVTSRRTVRRSRSTVHV